jgi:hypothetical protein
MRAAFSGSAVPCRCFSDAMRSIPILRWPAQVGFRYGDLGESALARQGLQKATSCAIRPATRSASSSTPLSDRDFTGNLEQATNVGNVGGELPARGVATHIDRGSRPDEHRPT